MLSYFKCGCIALSTLRPSNFVVSWNVNWDHPAWTISNLKSTILFQGAGFPPGLPREGGLQKRRGCDQDYGDHIHYSRFPNHRNCFRKRENMCCPFWLHFILSINWQNMISRGIICIISRMYLRKLKQSQKKKEGGGIIHTLMSLLPMNGNSKGKVTLLIWGIPHTS